MATLTKVQQEALNNIIDYINFAKKFNNFKDYYIAERLRGLENRYDYKKLVEYHTKQFERNEIELTKTYKHYWLDALNNIALTTRVSSSTLRVLEKLNYIEIVEDGGSWVDTIKLLRIDLLEVRA